MISVNGVRDKSKQYGRRFSRRLRLASGWFFLCAVFFAMVPLRQAFAAEPSGAARLEELYANAFSFNPDGVPLVTVLLMDAVPEVELSCATALAISTNGQNRGLVSGGKRVKVRAKRTSAARFRDWAIVERLGANDLKGVVTASRQWQGKSAEGGLDVKTFEVGTVFGLAGTVFDSREVLLGVAPKGAHTSAGSAGWGGRREVPMIKGESAQTFSELAALPTGQVTARAPDGWEISNPQVLWFRCHQGAPVKVHKVRVGGDGSQKRDIHLEDRLYGGHVYVTLGHRGGLVVGNAVDAETMLEGIVPSEIYASAPGEAIRAQAIAARTELLSQLGKRFHGQPYLTCSTQKCQVYGGVTRRHPLTTKAVRATRGEILFRPSGSLVDARYSANSGGHSENNENIWGGEPDQTLRGRPDASLLHHPKFRPFLDGVPAEKVREFLALPAAAADAGRAPGSKRSFRWVKDVPASEIEDNLRARAD